MASIIDEKRLWWPSPAYRRDILAERRERLAATALPVTARDLLLRRRRVSLGLSPQLYRWSLVSHFLGHFSGGHRLETEGLSNVPTAGPWVFVMKHRMWADIAMHSASFTWRTSGLHKDLPSWELASDHRRFREITAAGSYCHFVMKEDLLTLPIGLHIVLNGGIPVLQDLETKTKNSPGFDPASPAVLRQRERMARWYQFKDSYREIRNVLSGGGAIMIYGEATRMGGERMGHISTRFLERLGQIEGVKYIPVGSRVEGRTYRLAYGEPCAVAELRDAIAGLSGIPESGYVP